MYMIEKIFLELCTCVILPFKKYEPDNEIEDVENLDKWRELMAKMCIKNFFNKFVENC